MIRVPNPHTILYQRTLFIKRPDVIFSFPMICVGMSIKVRASGTETVVSLFTHYDALRAG